MGAGALRWLEGAAAQLPAQLHSMPDRASRFGAATPTLLASTTASCSLLETCAKLTEPARASIAHATPSRGSAPPAPS
jgi:hypothetical protein